MVFTLVFEEFGVDITGEDARRLLHIDWYSDRSLHRMRYHKINGRWVKEVSCQRLTRSDILDEDFAIVGDDDDEEDDDAADDDKVEAEAPMQIDPLLERHEGSQLA